jgi:hypothetical protein
MKQGTTGEASVHIDAPPANLIDAMQQTLGRLKNAVEGSAS